MKSHRKLGFTLIELMMTILISLLVISGIGVAMVDTIKSFPVMNERAQGSVVTDAYTARAGFDRFCRRASIKYSKPQIGNSSTSLEVYYYNSDTSPALDRYASFSVIGSNLYVTYGACSISGPATAPVVNYFTTPTPGTEILATTVDSVLFTTNSADITMALRLKKGNQSMTITSTALRHN